MEQTEISEMSAYKIQMPGNYSEESIKHSENSESLKSRMCKWLIYYVRLIKARVPPIWRLDGHQNQCGPSGEELIHCPCQESKPRQYPITPQTALPKFT
jgi:hypothetical protein